MAHIKTQKPLNPRVKSKELFEKIVASINKLPSSTIPGYQNLEDNTLRVIDNIEITVDMHSRYQDNYPDIINIELKVIATDNKFGLQFNIPDKGMLNTSVIYPNHSTSLATTNKLFTALAKVVELLVRDNILDTNYLKSFLVAPCEL